MLSVIVIVNIKFKKMFDTFKNQYQEKKLGNALHSGYKELFQSNK